MQQDAASGASSICRVLREQVWGAVAVSRSAGMNAESHTAKNYRETAEEIKQLARRARSREIDDELSDIVEP
jgi:F0F1-type ATP synthase gamma subunit